jgi:glutamate synthase (NADPH/NADH) small chain
VAVYEREDRIGGLLRYGIPDFKMEKKQIEQRLAQMTAEGTRFRAGVEIGRDITWDDLRARYDAVVVATGATVPRDLPIPGRDLSGIHFAMEYLVQQNKAGAGDTVSDQITAEGKHVVVLGGGDTGADCIGTAHRQGALSVTNLAIGQQPPEERPEAQPWPMFPTLFEVASAHEEGGERMYLASTVEFLRNEVGEVRAIRVAETEYVDGRRVPRAGTEREIPADLVLLALGFTGPERDELEAQLRLPFDGRGVLERDARYQTTQPGVFVTGDAGRGQSLIVWAIAEGRATASAVDAYLEGTTVLPFPVKPTDRSISV